LVPTTTQAQAQATPGQAKAFGSSLGSLYLPALEGLKNVSEVRVVEECWDTHV